MPNLLAPELVSTNALYSASPDGFHATTKAHGLYSTNHFVLRLSPLIHEKLASVKSGIVSNQDIDFSMAQAMSTYIHETIHWWQHIGSTYGFIYNLNYPVQTHSIHGLLKKLLDGDGFKKSIFLQAKNLNKAPNKNPDSPCFIANRIVNDHFDILSFRGLTLGPNQITKITNDPLFECTGHTFFITYGQTLFTIAATVDERFEILPNPTSWGPKFNALRNQRVQNFYYGSPVIVAPIGSYEIFEGQACFSQIQYLSHASGHRLTWDDFQEIGMIHGVYRLAFDKFLELTESTWPATIDDPLVSLFLLICDLSINPGKGFPFNLTAGFDKFVEDTTPGIRFSNFCRHVAKEQNSLKKFIRNHSREEYETASSSLCLANADHNPIDIAAEFSRWFSVDSGLNGLRQEYATYNFPMKNYMVRYLLAHFLAFQEDKKLRPEFFCWPGAWLAGNRVSAAEQNLFEKHSSLFVDKKDDDSVFPRIQNGRTEASVHRAFQAFYDNAVVLDLTNQWISEAGDFRYDLRWLSASASDDEARTYMKRQFKAAFSVDPDNAEILRQT
jgi:hypothetical protein